MVAYRLKVTFATGGKEYLPGSILPADIASSDFQFLKSKKFIEIVDVSEGSNEEFDEDFEGFDDEDFGLMVHYFALYHNVETVINGFAGEGTVPKG